MTSKSMSSIAQQKTTGVQTAHVSLKKMVISPPRAIPSPAIAAVTAINNVNASQFSSFLIFVASFSRQCLFQSDFCHGNDIFGLQNPLILFTDE